MSRSTCSSACRPRSAWCASACADHQSIKRVIAAFERIASHASFRFFGNVEGGRDLPVELLLAEYHALVFATGSADGQAPGRAGEDLPGSEPATRVRRLVLTGIRTSNRSASICRPSARWSSAWQRGHGRSADFGARPSELADSDITHGAPQCAPRQRRAGGRVAGRLRAIAQAAFEQSELGDIAELHDVAVSVDGDLPNVELSGLTPGARKNVEILAKARRRSPETRRATGPACASKPPRCAVLGTDRVTGVRVEHNTLSDGPGGAVSCPRERRLRTRFRAWLVLRSIGYRGVAVPGVPFDETRGVFPNETRANPGRGRSSAARLVRRWLESNAGRRVFVGTNKGDAKETVQSLLADARLLHATHAPCHPERIVDRLRELGVRALTFADWQRIDSLEARSGQSQGQGARETRQHRSHAERSGTALAPAIPRCRRRTANNPWGCRSVSGLARGLVLP